MGSRLAIVLLLMVPFMQSCRYRLRGESTKPAQILESMPKTGVSLSKRYSVRVTKKRRLSQARKILQILQKLRIEAYIVESYDEGEGIWYNVMSGFFDDRATSDAHAAFLESEYHLSGLMTVDTRELSDGMDESSSDVSHSTNQSSSTRIKANEPSLPENIRNLLQVFPYNENIRPTHFSLYNFEAPGELEKTSDVSFELFSSVSRGQVEEVASSLVEVQFENNRSEYQLTLCAASLKGTGIGNVDHLFDMYGLSLPEHHHLCYAITLDFATRIIRAGSYECVKFKCLEWNAYKTLVGYKMSITKNTGSVADYYLLVDIDGDVLFIAHSVRQSEIEFQRFLGATKYTRGLVHYSPFYNLFYLLPVSLPQEDVFLGYNMEIIGSDYVRRKCNASWARGMEGCWMARAYYFNRRKGLWSVGIFDLFTHKTQELVYGELYANVQPNEARREVLGVLGHFCGSIFCGGFELSFGYGRYICTIHSANIEQEEFYFDRASRLQLGKSY